MAYIKGEDRNQIIMFPECIDDYILEDNPVRVIDVFVQTLDLKELGFKKINPNAVGHPSYDPKDMLKLYLYGYLNRIRSSRRLEHEAIRNIELIWLLRKLRPDFKTIADFRKDNKKAIKQIFREFTKLCDEWELFGKELVAIATIMLMLATMYRPR
ncbi:Transposase [Anaerovirgula multivorans]|uniref:Transposase n=1 Tax=Anaerovirgula multivorans TaxID=312168 RepID=A0A239DGD3_9FIRM|nr:transposase [Anaerovirgula multivorans]SNS31399.1 Transposase [Anaerovirgula multivorans]